MRSCMKRFTLIVFLILYFCFAAFAQTQSRKEEIVDVNFCDLLKNPTQYKDKIIRTTAIYTFAGVEFSQLYYPRCYSEIETTFQCNEENQNCISQNLKKIFSAKGLKSLRGKTIKITTVGKIESKEFSGSLDYKSPQLNFYRNTFFAQTVEKAGLVLNVGGVFSALTEKDKAKVIRKIESKQK